MLDRLLRQPRLSTDLLLADVVAPPGLYLLRFIAERSSIADLALPEKGVPLAEGTPGQRQLPQQRHQLGHNSLLAPPCNWVLQAEIAGKCHHLQTLPNSLATAFCILLRKHCE